MTANQFRAALSKLSLTQAGAGELFGIALRTSQGYALGEYPIPMPVAILIRLLLAGKITPEDIDASRR